MGKIDPASAPRRDGTGYPAPFHSPCLARSYVRLGDAAGLTQFGVNLAIIPPGSWSSQRHWHSHQDEFVYVLEGELVLVTDAGEQPMGAGDCAGFRAGDPDGHHLQNRSGRPATLLVVGSRIAGDHGEYPDLDMIFDTDGRYRHRDGTPYPERE